MDKRLTYVPEETEEPRPEYQPPQIVSYSDEEILEEMGPAQAIYGIIEP
jgi:hypothetical protein